MFSWIGRKIVSMFILFHGKNKYKLTNWIRWIHNLLNFKVTTLHLLQSNVVLTSSEGWFEIHFDEQKLHNQVDLLTYSLWLEITSCLIPDRKYLLTPWSSVGKGLLTLKAVSPSFGMVWNVLVLVLEHVEMYFSKSMQ